MMTALARQGHSRTEQAGLLARAALAVAAERMGGLPPQPFLRGEETLRAEIIKDVRRRLKIAPDDASDEALRAIEADLDAEMEAVGEPVDVEAALARVAALLRPRRRDALLDQARALAAAHPEDAALREQLAKALAAARERLAKGLANAMLDAAEEGQPEKGAQLQEELAQLAASHPDDEWVGQFRSAGLL